MTHPQCRKVLLQGRVGLESHGLAAGARLASIENTLKNYKFTAESVFVEIFEWYDANTETRRVF